MSCSQPVVVTHAYAKVSMSITRAHASRHSISLPDSYSDALTASLPAGASPALRSSSSLGGSAAASLSSSSFRDLLGFFVWRKAAYIRVNFFARVLRRAVSAAFSPTLASTASTSSPDSLSDSLSLVCSSWSAMSPVVDTEGNSRSIEMLADGSEGVVVGAAAAVDATVDTLLEAADAGGVLLGVNRVVLLKNEVIGACLREATLGGDSER